MCSNFIFVGAKGRLPGGVLTSLLKKHWPGLYKVGDGEQRKLALKWEDYEVAKAGGLMRNADGETFVPTCAQVVQTKFWVRLFFRAFFMVQHPTVLTYDFSPFMFYASL